MKMLRSFSPALALSGFVVMGAASAAGEVSAANKSSYSLVNPTPTSLLRELSTDRPDQTESPYTVDAGHFQIEMDFAKFTQDRDTTAGNDLRTRDWTIAPVNLKIGLLNSVDLQLMVNPYVSSRVDDRAAGTRTKVSGFGDVTTRLKINFWGNDGGTTALAVMPFVKWPLSASEMRNGKTEGGVIVPFGIELSPGWGLGAMTEVDFVSDGAGGYETEWINSVTLARDFTERLGGYVEFFSVTSRAPGYKWQGQLDVGFTYALGANAQFDFGCNFGVTKSAPDFEPFVGFSRRY